MQDAKVGPAGGAAVVGPLDQQGSQPATGGFEGERDAVDAAADHDQIVISASCLVWCPLDRARPGLRCHGRRGFLTAAPDYTIFSTV